MWRAVFEEEYYELHPDKRPRENLNDADGLRNFFKNSVKHKSKT